MCSRSRRAFTLVELLLVIVILGVLAALAIPRIAHSGNDTKVKTCLSNITIVNKQIELWAAAHDWKYPANQAEFEANILNNTDVFPQGPPVCPFGKAYVYDTAKQRVTHHTKVVLVEGVSVLKHEVLP